ncbi:MAG: hypothetical protein Q8922_01720 [Bacteroidota bacterium]|nr:hypothetical protein [Bacteroidota bacterium]MDP4232054.1 hypothetical protein [Bacteroidota bacterium]MDP4241239.1 hypothetical protein [Bacteroidota bacterium]MDP4286631.1 hypothetical protein [Bacteroidota bacterium]
MRKSVIGFFVLFIFPSIVLAQGSGGVFIQPQQPIRIASDEGTLAFERPKLDFAPQSIGIENCANVSLTNTTDHPRLLTQLRSMDPRHFSISSPSAEMLPITVGANTSFYINICFKAEETKAYASKVIAIFQSDTVLLTLSGKGVTPPEVMKLPDDAAITAVKFKKHQWTFQFGLKSRAYVKLTLENMTGKVVRTFPFEELKTPGYYEVPFNGKSDADKKLEKGMYVLRLEATDPSNGKKIHSSKVVTIR